MKILIAVGVIATLLCGCHDNVSELVCQHNGGIKSWHGHDSYLEVTCKDGTVFNVDWI